MERSFTRNLLDQQGTIGFVFMGLFVFSAYADVASVLPDFYNESNVKESRANLSENYNEIIDPFSGALHQSYIDLVVPGPAGHDIVVQRNYSSKIYVSRKTVSNTPPFPRQLLPRTPSGIGWVTHFGRVVLSLPDGANVNSICDLHMDNLEDSTDNNPVLELADGTMKPLFVAGNLPGLDWQSRDLSWFANCNTSGDGLVITSASGTRYHMDHYVASLDEVTFSTRFNRAWYTTRIEDKYGNNIFIEYAGQQGSHALISRIWGDDDQDLIFNPLTDRQVRFSYQDVDNGKLRLLKQIEANGQTTRYTYESAGAEGLYQLAAVTRPDSSQWQYHYYPDDHSEAGHYALAGVVYPYGATVDFTYRYVDFYPDGHLVAALDKFYSVAVASKTNGGRDVTPGTWSYAYEPGFELRGLVPMDRTTVTAPGGKTIHIHNGIKVQSAAHFPDFALIGKLVEKQIYNVDGQGLQSLLQHEYYDWETFYAVSSENEYRPPINAYYRSNVDEAVLKRRDIIRDGTSYVTQYHYDEETRSPDPVSITEIGQVEQTNRFSYFPFDYGLLVNHQIKDEMLDVVFGPFGVDCLASSKNICRSFNSRADVVSENRRGQNTSWSYYSNGDLLRERNAEQKDTTYGDYKLGIAQSEVLANGVELTRTVNATGTVASETNGRGLTTSYKYDVLNRLTRIDRPLGADLQVTWSGTGRTVSRGLYQHVTTFDGFGRPTCVSAAGLSQRTDYDARGNKVFVSHVDSKPCAQITAGISYQFDFLNRPTRISQNDGSTQTNIYLADNRVQITNSKGAVTTKTFRSWGDPDRRQLMRVDYPEAVTTEIDRNVLGLVTGITQSRRGLTGLESGLSRTFNYDDRNLLISQYDPEVGLTQYLRNNLGHVLRRRIGESPWTEFDYDPLMRLENIRYPDDEVVSMKYDENGNVLSVNRGVVSKHYTWDNNDNLLSEEQYLGGEVFNFVYQYTELDYLSRLTYPSGRILELLPNPLGRATQITPVINAISWHPAGAPAQISWANGLVSYIGLNNRQWPARLSASNDVLDLAYQYDTQGNVERIDDTIAENADKVLDYDDLDRLIAASGRWGNETFSYDHLDNILQSHIGGALLSRHYDSFNRLSVISGFLARSYYYNDDYGDVTDDGVNTYTYDHAPNLLSITGNVWADYLYDGDNMRVLETREGITTLYVYTKAGNLVGEYRADGEMLKEHVYLGSKLVTTFESDLSQSRPTANAGTDFTAREYEITSLDGSASNDADGSIVSYDWIQVRGPAVELQAIDTATAKFVSPIVNSYTELEFRLRVTDNLGAQDSDRVVVTIDDNLPPDTEAPVISPPTDITVEAIGLLTPVNTGVATALDSLEGLLPVSPDIASPFPIGQHLVTWSATDSSGNTGTATQQVHVLDTTLPSLTIPGDITVSRYDVPVELDPGVASATDLFTPVVVSNDAPASFPIGQTIITWTATDANGNRATATQIVTIEPDLTPPDMPDQLEVYAWQDNSTLLVQSGERTDGFNIYWSTVAGVTPSTGNKIENVKLPFNHRSIAEQTTHYYIVTAVSRYGIESAPSGEQSVLTGSDLDIGWSIPIFLRHDAMLAEPLLDDAGGAWLVGRDHVAGRIWAKQYVPANGWRDSGYIDNGLPTDWPFVRMDSQGNVFVLWVDFVAGESSSNGIYVAKYDAALNQWTEPVSIGGSKADGFRRLYAFEVDNEGNAAVVWLYYGTATEYQLYASYYSMVKDEWDSPAAVSRSMDGPSYTPFTPSGDIASGTAAFADDGSLHIIWSTESGTTEGPAFHIISNRLQTGSWTWDDESVLDVNVNPLEESRLVIDNTGNLTAVWNAFDSQEEIRSRRFERSWSARQVLAIGRARFLGIDDADRLLVLGERQAAPPDWNYVGYAKQHLPFTGWQGEQQIGDFSNADEPFLTQAAVIEALGSAAAIVVDDGAFSALLTYTPTQGWIVDNQLGSCSRDCSPMIGLGSPGHAWYLHDTGQRLKAISRPPVGNAGPELALSHINANVHDQKITVSAEDHALVTWLHRSDFGEHVWANFYAAPESMPNQSPVANAGGEQWVDTNSPVTLNGNASFDVDGDIISHDWQQVAGPGIVIVDSGNSLARFQAPLLTMDTDLVFELTVIDDEGSQDTDQVMIHVRGSGEPLPAELIEPANGTILSDVLVNFTWDAGVAVEDTILRIGTSPGGRDIYSKRVSGGNQWVELPLHGDPVHVRLRSKINGYWHDRDYEFASTVGGTDPAAQLVLPLAGSLLSDRLVEFQWTTGIDVDRLMLRVGSSAGARDIYSKRVSGASRFVDIPLSGAPLFVRLESRIHGVWLRRDYQFNTTQGGSDPAARLLNPADGLMLSSTLVNFQWTAGTEVEKYRLRIGSTMNAKDIYSRTVTTTNLWIDIPLTGDDLYFRLDSYSHGIWMMRHTTVQTTVGGTDPAAKILSPETGSLLASSPVEFTWEEGVGIESTVLKLGSSPGANDIYSKKVNGSVQVVNIPINGNPVYVRLQSRINGIWLKRDYTYFTSGIGN